MIEIVLITLCLLVIYYLFNGAIPLPSRQQAIINMIEMARPQVGQSVVELGSGDGRVVRAFAETGVSVEGFEINPLLSWWSKWKLRKFSNVKIYTNDFWQEDISKYDIVVVFGMTHIMERLSQKIKQEAKPNTVIISNLFSLPGFTLVEERGGVKKYVVS